MSDAESAATVLLLSGGLDSTALAKLMRPSRTLYIDYGQRSAQAERTASAAVARELNLVHDELRIDLRAIGGGLMHDSAVPSQWPSPEWWPYRNQLLITAAAAWVLTDPTNTAQFTGREVVISVAIVGTDRRRHRDGSPEFVAALNSLLGLQEGRVSLRAPGIDSTTQELIRESGVTDAVLGWTHSCHTSDTPCFACPGCYKRSEVLADLGRLQ